MGLYHDHAFTLTDVAIVDAAPPSAGITEADADLIAAESVEYATNIGGPNKLDATAAVLVVTATLTLVGGLPTNAYVRWDFGLGRVEKSPDLVQNWTYPRAGVYQIRATVFQVGKTSRDYFTQVKAG